MKGQDAVRQRRREVPVMGRDEHRRAVVGESRECCGDELSSARIESAGGLVDEEHPRRRRQLQRERQASPLTRGQVERMPFRQRSQAEGVGIRAHEHSEPPQRRPGGQAGVPVGPPAFGRHRVADEEVVRGIRHEGDSAERPPRCHRRAVQGDVGGGIRNRDPGQQARLARAVRSDQGRDLTGAEGEARVAHGIAGVVPNSESPHREDDRPRLRCTARSECRLLGGLRFGERPVVDREAPVGDPRELGGAVLRDHDAHPGVMGEGTQECDDPLPIGGVEVGERLVDQQEYRVLHDGSGDGDERGLAGGQSAQSAVEQGTDADRLGHLVDAGGDDHPSDPSQLEGEPDLVAHALAGERLARLLQDDADALGGVARAERRCGRDRRRRGFP